MQKRKLPLEIKMDTNGTLLESPSKQMKFSPRKTELHDTTFEHLLIGVDFDESIGAKSPRKRANVDSLLDGIDFNESMSHSSPKEVYLDLTEWRRCIVQTIERVGFDVILYGHEECLVEDMKNEGVKKRFKCYLQDAWSHCKVKENCLVSLVAEWNNVKSCYCISNKSGFLIIYPDQLISGTTVVGSLFCLRKAILSDRFKGIASGNKIMTVGSIVHELFQIVLHRKLSALSQIRTACEELLNSRNVAFQLYASEMTAKEAWTELENFIEKIFDFVEEYVNGKKIANRKPNNKGFDGQIDSIQDIEENIWIPKLGLKGKVDVSINVRSKNNPGKLQHMPLELKTGRASFSSEHTGQLIIYQMMMSEIAGNPIDSGVLLYLREGVIKEVRGTRNEQRDLILLRNELAYYLSKQNESYANFRNNKFNDNENSCDSLETEFNKLALTPELPEPINHHSACGSCPYNIICSTYLKKNEKMKNSLGSSHPLREISNLVTIHLNESYVNYFCHWAGILALEDQETRKTNLLKNIWTQEPETRHEKGLAVIDLKLGSNVIADADDAFIHEFVSESIDLMSRGLAVGEYLIVSTRERISVAAGRVVTIETNRIKMCLERDLTKRYANRSFILDKYESQTIASFNMANLGALLDDSEASEGLRKIIIDKVKPTFLKTLPKVISSTGKLILRDLNPIQRTAVLKALTSNEYLLLKGLPGTGKTQTVITIIRLLSLLGKSILITSHTHSAVDNVLLRLKKTDPNVKFMRLGSRDRIKEELRDQSESSLTEHCQTSDDFKAVYESYNIVGVTCLGAAHPLVTQKTFDVCLVDESTQVFQPTILRPLFSAKKFILIGDPDQLPPIVRSAEARHLGADESLFVRLDCKEATVALTMQYRMNKSITKLANDLTYRGALKCANDNVSLGTLKLSKAIEVKWLQKLLSTHVDQSVCFLNTGNVLQRCVEFVDVVLKNTNLTENLNIVNLAAKNSCENEALKENPKKSVRLYTNYCEAAVILAIVRQLIEAGVAASTIGVIAPYVLQVELLKQIIHKHIGTDVEVNTVDQYQGRDKEVIIYSCTKTGSSDKSQSSSGLKRNRIEILEDHRRLTVAVTRAKHKLIMVGDVKALETYTPFKILLKGMSGMNKTNLTEGHHGFNWTDLLAELNKN